MRQAFLGEGLQCTNDANGGNPLGVAAYTENWRDGKCQPSGKAYGLDHVHVITTQTVKRIIVEGNVAKGAELVSGEKLLATKEVILSCGSIRSPQILMLSGIGPSEELAKHGIGQIVESQDVGSSFNSLRCLAQFYKVCLENPELEQSKRLIRCCYMKIKNPENSLAAGASGWTDPSYTLGVPADTVVTVNPSKEKLKAAMIKDSTREVTDSHPHLAPSRGHIEILPLYAPTKAPLTGLNVPFNRTRITVSTLNLLPTSRGSVRLYGLE